MKTQSRHQAMFNKVVGESGIKLDVDAPNNMFSVITLLALHGRALALEALDPDLNETERKALLEKMAAQSTQIAEVTVILDRLVRVHHEATLNRVVTDTLTGVHNRAYFDPAFEEARTEAGLTGTPLALIAFDIDFFKSVHDTHGHAAGDEVLKIFAQQLRKGVKDTDIVARYGGEEFMVVLPGVTHDEAIKIANRLRLAVQARKAHPGAPAVTVSGGLTMLHDNDTTDMMKKRADDLLYAAKRQGRNIIVSSEQSNVIQCPANMRNARRVRGRAPG